MEDSENIIYGDDGDKHMIAAAQHILKALTASKKVSSDMRILLADLDCRLSEMAKSPGNEAERIHELEDQLVIAQKKVIIWKSDQSEIKKCIHVADEIQRLTESLRALPNRNRKENELLDQAETSLQISMVKLEEVLIHVLHQNKLSFAFPNPSCRSREEVPVYGTKDGTELDINLTELVHPGVISDIKSVANVMFASLYNQEFCEAFIRFCKFAMDEYLAVLGVEKLSTETVMKMEWGDLSLKIKKWCQAIKVIVRFVLLGVKQLFGQVLGEFGSTSLTCFIDASRTLVLPILDFGQAVALGPRQPERLFCLVDMYEVLTDTKQEIDVLFPDDVGLFVRTEFQELWNRLGDAAKATFVEVGNQVASTISSTPFPNGKIHHITKYVMNYIKLLSSYSDTLVSLFNDQDEGKSDIVPHPIASNLWALTSVLETNLESKSSLYKNCSLKHLFMMNNIHYMVQKVRDGGLRKYFGDEWVRTHIVKYKQNAMSFVRVTWLPLFSLLGENGNRGKPVLKERCKSFNSAFEEAYKIQTGWCVPDSELRSDLQIMVTQEVIHAYQSFISRNTASKDSALVCEKQLKYTADELGNYILDLYAGSPKKLQYAKRG